jgi:hypothetical protein
MVRHRFDFRVRVADEALAVRGFAFRLLATRISFTYRIM